MTNPFTPPPGGFGFGPADRRALHQQRRHARREFREQLRDNVIGHDAGPDFPGNFGPGRGFEFGFDPAPWASAPAAASAQAGRAHVAVVAADTDAVAAVDVEATSARRFSSCWPSSPCTATR